MQSVVTDDKNIALGSVMENIKSELSKIIGPNKYKIWFEGSTKMAIQDQYLKIEVPNLFIAGWLENHFAEDIQKAVKNITGISKKLTFSINAALAGKRNTRNTAGIKNDENTNNYNKPTQKKKISRYKKLRLTLDSFVVGSSNRLAFNAALTVANEEKSPFNPLFIHGGYGVGKTHLLQGICNAICLNQPGTDWLYISAEDFVNQFVLALKTKKLEAFRCRMRQMDLLAIDDIHFLAGKISTQEEFLHTFNSIDLAGKQVLLASDAHPKLITQLSDKLVNRFVSGMVVKIDQPDLETRFSICAQFAAKRKVPIADSVLKYIAEHLKTNVRELQGAMLKIIAFASLQNKKVNINIAKEILAEHIARTDPVVHVSDIETAVVTFFGITVADLHSAKKDRTISLARHFSMYLARKHTKMSSPEIGKCMGNKNHATVLLACKKIEEQVKNNNQLNWMCQSGNRVAKAKTILAKLEHAIAG